MAACVRRQKKRTPYRAGVFGLAIIVTTASVLSAGAPEPPPQSLSVSEAIRWALENNPELAAIRLQHGMAAADVVIADTYPFNPVSENRIQIAAGPEAAGVTNNLPLEHLLLFEVEIRGQRRIRRGGAAAALARTDWEIGAQEQAL